jgi:excisionase family DNA binding protein
MDRKTLLTVKEAAEILRINHRVLGRWIGAGRLRAINIGTGRKVLRIDPDEIELYLKKHACRT